MTPEEALGTAEGTGSGTPQGILRDRGDIGGTQDRSGDMDRDRGDREERVSGIGNNVRHRDSRWGAAGVWGTQETQDSWGMGGTFGHLGTSRMWGTQGTQDIRDIWDSDVGTEGAAGLGRTWGTWHCRGHGDIGVWGTQGTGTAGTGGNEGVQWNLGRSAMQWGQKVHWGGIWGALGWNGGQGVPWGDKGGRHGQGILWGGAEGQYRCVMGYSRGMGGTVGVSNGALWGCIMGHNRGTVGVCKWAQWGHSVDEKWGTRGCSGGV